MKNPVEEEFEEFFKGNSAKLYGFLIKMGLSASDAEDVAAESFLVCLQSWGTIRISLLGFLYKVAKREAYKRRKPTRVMIEELAADPPDVPGGDFAQQVADWQALRWGLLELSDRERDAVLLRYYVGFDAAESAIIMDDISPNTVRGYAKSGLGKLKNVFRDEMRDRTRRGVTQGEEDRDA